MSRSGNYEKPLPYHKYDTVKPISCHQCLAVPKIDMAHRETHSLGMLIQNKFPHPEGHYVDFSVKAPGNSELPFEYSDCSYSKTFDESQCEFLVKLLIDVKTFLDHEFDEKCKPKQLNVRIIDEVVSSIRAMHFN